jgi:hypothetical protein
LSLFGWYTGAKWPNRIPTWTAALAITLWVAVYSSSAPATEASTRPCREIVPRDPAARTSNHPTGSEFARHIDVAQVAGTVDQPRGAARQH